VNKIPQWTIYVHLNFELGYFYSLCWKILSFHLCIRLIFIWTFSWNRYTDWWKSISGTGESGCQKPVTIFGFWFLHYRLPIPIPSPRVLTYLHIHNNCRLELMSRKKPCATWILILLHFLTLKGLQVVFPSSYSVQLQCKPGTNAWIKWTC